MEDHALHTLKFRQTSNRSRKIFYRAKLISQRGGLKIYWSKKTIQRVRDQKIYCSFTELHLWIYSRSCMLICWARDLKIHRSRAISSTEIEKFYGIIYLNLPFLSYKKARPLQGTCQSTSLWNLTHFCLQIFSHLCCKCQFRCMFFVSFPLVICHFVVSIDRKTHREREGGRYSEISFSTPPTYKCCPGN